VQATVLPIADRHNDYARQVVADLKAEGVRAEADERTESIGKKIRAAELQKIPYMLVVGDAEVDERLVGVRRHREGDLGSMTQKQFVERVRAATLGAE
jgi:threonyl-tRNA synthetase